MCSIHAFSFVVDEFDEFDDSIGFHDDAIAKGGEQLGRLLELLHLKLCIHIRLYVSDPVFMMRS